MVWLYFRYCSVVVIFVDYVRIKIREMILFILIVYFKCSEREM